MLERDPGRYGKWAKGIDGSGRNPLSARALNLVKDGKDVPFDRRGLCSRRVDRLNNCLLVNRRESGSGGMLPITRACDEPQNGRWLSAMPPPALRRS